MPDRYLPCSTACGKTCSSPRRDDPREGAHGDARMGGEQATSRGGNSDSPAVSLSPQEIRVLAISAEGGTDKMIARRLNISAATVNTHCKLIFIKLGARNRTQAVVKALRSGLLRLEDIAC